jgi:hypothetical protein
MSTNRLEAFSDGVIAIIVTIMVLELHPPSQPTLAALGKVAPVFISYALSFLVVAIMWVNHHHLIHAVHAVSARLLWTNIYLLFWMSLVPFVTDYLGKNYHEPLAVALYGLDLVLCSNYPDRAGSPRFRFIGIPCLDSAQERFFRRALPRLGSVGLRLGLRFVLYLRADPRVVLFAREDAGGL